MESRRLAVEHGAPLQNNELQRTRLGFAWCLAAELGVMRTELTVTLTYPLVPKSTRHLSPGQFWAIPLSDGSCACGRILELMPAGMPGARVGFLGALLDWRGRQEPTADAFAGAGMLEQGVMHLLWITATGGAVLGLRPLQLDRLEPWVFINGNVVQRGFTVLRPWRRSDADELPTLSWWGYDVIETLAHKRLLPAGASGA